MEIPSNYRTTMATAILDHRSNIELIANRIHEVDKLSLIDKHIELGDIKHKLRDYKYKLIEESLNKQMYTDSEINMIISNTYTLLISLCDTNIKIANNAGKAKCVVS